MPKGRGIRSLVFDETLFEYYDGMTFTEDDFFCNLEKKETE